MGLGRNIKAAMIKNAHPVMIRGRLRQFQKSQISNIAQDPRALQGSLIELSNARLGYVSSAARVSIP